MTETKALRWIVWLLMGIAVLDSALLVIDWADGTRSAVHSTLPLLLALIFAIEAIRSVLIRHAARLDQLEALSKRS